MREFKFVELGEEYVIVSLSVGENAPRLVGKALAFTPFREERCDLVVNSVGNDEVDRESAKRLVANYLSCVRGYPACSLDIMLQGKREIIEIFNTSGSVCVQDSLKCKQIYTNTITMPNLVELELTTLIYPMCKVRLYECCDIELCEKDLLWRILVIDGLLDADFSVILSQGEGGVSYIANRNEEIIKKAINDYLDFK